MKFDAPMVIHRSVVRPDWIDWNGHMSVACYLVAFDAAGLAMLDLVGLDANYRATTTGSTFALDTRVVYLREVKLDDPLRFDVHLIEYDQKRFHFMLRMLHDTENYVAALCQWISMHMDMSKRRGAPFPDHVLARLAAMHEAHRHLPVPDVLRRPIGLQRRA
ncbi:MAG: thioesterase family protein [Alphaproteobacteria bacterium]